jgi:hypothetical protein
VKIKLYMPQHGTVIVDIEDERTLVSLQDMVARPVEIEFPREVVIEAEEPTLTGYIVRT